MKQYRMLLLLIIPVVLATVFFTTRITSKLSKYEEKKQEKAELLDAETRLGNAWEWLPSWLSGSEDTMQKSRDIDSEANKYYASAARDGLIMLLLIVAFLIAINLLYKTPEVRQQAIGLSLIVAAACFLYLGLNEPFIEIEAFKDDVEVSGEVLGTEIGAGVGGRVYFFYANKSVLSLIALLYKGGNYLVAVLLITFSLIFPITKLVASTVFFLAPHTDLAQKSYAFIDKIGKWSMAEVFVAASWLSYFSFANTEFAIETGSNTLLGLYFFTAFVVISLFSGYYLKRTILKSFDQKIKGG